MAKFQNEVLTSIKRFDSKLIKTMVQIFFFKKKQYFKRNVITNKQQF